MDKYGHENVSQMITYGRLQGRSALKEVLRINKACGFAEMNAMTKPIPDEAAISDQLELMDEEDRGIIRWTLINDPESLRQFCHIDENGELKGDYAPFFDQAMRLEGTYKNLGKHAAGVVISKYPLSTVCPMLPSKDGERIAGFEMNNLADIGLVKLDVLAVVLFDKLMYIEELAGI
jgi:DNA polymerase-3 subunit alpha